MFQVNVFAILVITMLVLKPVLSAIGHVSSALVQVLRNVYHVMLTTIESCQAIVVIVLTLFLMMDLVQFALTRIVISLVKHAVHLEFLTAVNVT